MLYLVTALVTGFLGLPVLFAPSYFSGPFYWLPLTAFGGPILLLIGGIHTLFPQVKKGVLIAIPGIILFIVWVTFMRHLSWAYSLFAGAVILITWGVLAISSLARKDGLTALIASVMVALIWIPGTIHTFIANFSMILIAPREVSLLLLPLLLMWGLIVGCVIYGFILTKSPGVSVQSMRSFGRGR
jgi:hypothetical protein